MAIVSQDKIMDALRLLEEAAKDNKNLLRQTVTGKYESLKDAIIDEREKLGLLGQRAAEMAKHVKDVSEEKAKEIAETVDQSVHKNPWPYIGGVAVIALLLGAILGRKTS